MADKRIALPERVAARVAQATSEVQQVKQSAEAEIRSIQRRQSEVLDTFLELRGIEVPQDAQVRLDGDENTGEMFLVYASPDSPDDADEATGVSASAEAPARKRKPEADA